MDFNNIHINNVNNFYDKRLKESGFLWLYNWIFQLKFSPDIITMNDKENWLNELNIIKLSVYDKLKNDNQTFNNEYINDLLIESLGNFMINKPKLYFMIKESKSRLLGQVLNMTKQICHIDSILSKANPPKEFNHKNNDKNNEDKELGSKRISDIEFMEKRNKKTKL